LTFGEGKILRLDSAIFANTEHIALASRAKVVQVLELGNGKLMSLWAIQEDQYIPICVAFTKNASRDFHVLLCEVGY
jgi:hypothetical protein